MFAGWVHSANSKSRPELGRR